MIFLTGAAAAGKCVLLRLGMGLSRPDPGTKNVVPKKPSSAGKALNAGRSVLAGAATTKSIVIGTRAGRSGDPAKVKTEVSRFLSSLESATTIIASAGILIHLVL